MCQWRSKSGSTVAKGWRVPRSDPAFRENRRQSRAERRPRPLDAASLDELAIAYVGRFATTRQKLVRYLGRKLAERGWDGESLPDTAAIVGRLAGYGFIDDAAFAEMKARSLTRRGYGKRRVDAAVREAGVGDSDRAGADAISDAARVASALRLAERRRWGPYASEPVTDRAVTEKRIGAFIRAGHDARLARTILALAPGADTGHLE
jgi:regulatory protein